MANCIIIEDNYAFGIDTKMKAEEIGLNVLKLVTSHVEIEDSLTNSDVDIILSDVKLGPSLYAFDILKKIKPLPPVIFFSSYRDEELYSQSKTADPYIYLLKPFDLITLRSAVDGALKGHGKRPKAGGDIRRESNTLLIRSKGKLISVDPQKITFVKSEGNYCYINTAERKIVIRSSLHNVLAMIGNADFAQIHRSYVINLNLVGEMNIRTNEVAVADVSLPVGRSYKKDLQVLLSRL